VNFASEKNQVALEQKKTPAKGLISQVLIKYLV
jgi:hypothetical protein